MSFLFASKNVATDAPAAPPPALPVVAVQSELSAYRILLVDDEPEQRAYWAGILQKKGCKVLCAPNGEEAQRQASQGEWDCVLLDIKLCDESGFSLCRALREHTDAPVVFLSVLSDSTSQLQSFQSGGVDHIVKDTSPELFWAKVEARIRHSRTGRTLLCFEPLVLDLSNRRVTLEERELVFTPTEFELLWLLAEHSGQLCTPSELCKAVWGADHWDDGQTVQVHMSRMRRKLEKAYPAHYFIETVWGEGYRFVPGDKGAAQEGFQ